MRPDPETISLLDEWVPRRDLAAMRIVLGRPWRWLPALLGKTAITFAPFVIFASGGYRPSTAPGLALIAHEALHLTQVREMGRPRFYARYLLGQLQSGFRHGRHPLERPCIERQHHIRAALRARGIPG